MVLKRIITFLVGIALTLAVVSYFGLRETISVLLHTRLDILLMAVLLQLAVLFLLVLRVKILAYGKGYLPWPHAARLTLSGMFVSMITPLAKLGGEPLKMYMLRSNIGSHNASAAVAVESLMELLSSIFVVLAVTILFFNDVPPQFASTFLIFLAVVGLAFGILLKILFTPRWLHRIVDWFATKIARLLEAEKKDYTTLFSTAFYEMWQSKGKLYGAFFVSVLMKIAEMTRLWVVFMALSAFLPFKTVVIVWTILLVVLFIPWLPGSLGLVELGGISALLVFGLNASLAASGMVLDRFISFWMPLLIGLVAVSVAKTRGELPKLGKGKGKGKVQV